MPATLDPAMARPSIAQQLHTFAAAVLIATGLVLLSLAVPHSGIFAALWLPNAVLVGLALVMPWNRFPALLAGAGLGLMAGELIGAVPVGIASILTAANLTEIAVAVMLTRRLSGLQVDFTDPARFFRFVGALLLAAIASALIATAAGPQADIVAMFFARHAASLVFFAPLVIVAAAAALREKPATLDTLNPPVLVLVVGASLCIFGQSSFPFLFMATPLMVLAGIGSGLGGTAIAMLVIASIATVATAVGTGPIVLTKGDDGLQLISLQLFLATLTLVGLPLAGLMERGVRDRDALRASHDEKRRVLDNVDEIIFTIDAQDRWRTLNAAWDRITGQPRETAIGQAWDAFLPSDERDRAGRDLQRLRSGSIATSSTEMSFEHPDGRTRHVELHMRLTEGGDAVIGRMLDVSERATDRRALADSERQFETLAALAPAGLFRTDPSGMCTWVNAAWEESTGLKPDQWRGKGWADGIHPDDFDRVYYDWQASVAERRRFESEFRWRRPDGVVVWVRSAAAPQFDAEGALVGFIGINMDVTSSREAEAELAERDRRIKTITDNVRDALFMIAPDGSCSYASPYAGTMFAVPPETLIGRDLAALFGRAAAQAMTRRLGALWKGFESSCALQIQLDEPDGRWLDGKFSLVRRDDQGRPDAIVASIRDVTEAKRLEADLTEARRKAEHAAQAKAGFLANMSHEIRTPMNGVIGFTDLLLQSELSETQRRHAQLIADSGKAMMGLLNDILDMSKIDSGKLVIAPAPVDLRAKIATCVSLLQPVASRDGIALSSDVHSNVPDRLIGDPLRLRQILLNLIGNAVKFTERGEVAVKARVRPAGDGSEWLSIAVSDTGIGIAPERLQDIFEPFKQADGSIGRRYGGTGLGLAISSQLARLMGGQITADSRLGHGTTFTVRIPLIVADAGSQVETAGAEASAQLEQTCLPRPSAMPQMAGDPPRVLVAEDNDINQELVLAMARGAGVNPDLANDGAEAVRMVEAAYRSGDPYRLVLMDMQMPEMDGLEATRRLREGGFEPDMLPIVALTANCFADDIAACRQAGMQGHLGKPLQMDRLRETITMHINAEAPAKPKPEPETVASSMIGGAEGADLAARYRERKARLLHDLAEVAAGQSAPEWDVLAMQLHKLAGTAGYFGETRLGELARMLEDRLRLADEGVSRIDMVRREWDAIRAVA
ncbi:PAS domain S-box protein [Croceicoccus naphthovorans]|uniref:PAS domain S-box protein n=1 Tax=Croceicoccus naphthovorans TaxID=1348774 RepID=UPI00069FDE87|nr:PAS domain S-box protein [Croceicoccus naphthovorans]MBB3992123.1 PAS domain S-box-containing protein [Croceicoccus naphthovorans]